MDLNTDLDPERRRLHEKADLTAALPNTIWYIAAMLLFVAASAVLRQYYLAAGAFAVTLIVFIVSRVRFARRKRQLMSYVQTATDSVGISVHAGSAFPMAVIRLPENEIIWGNPSFFSITGLSDTACYQTLDAVIPGFSTSWLREGRSELPGDQMIGGRRYRIYGNYVRSEDDATTVQLANKSWKPKNNPYSTSVGQKVYDALNAETDSGGIVLPDGTSYTGGLVLPKG